MEEPLTLLLRLRPPQLNGHPTYWTKTGNSVIGDNGEMFHGDFIYEEPSNNYEIFQEALSKPVENTVDGYNAAVLAYGQSGAGKTHTLLGERKVEGILSHMVRYLFNLVEQQQKTTGRSFLVQLQVMELYCERVRDLLSDNSSATEPQIMEANNIPRVTNVTGMSVTSAEQTLHLVELAQSRRVVASTELNDQSSRSHAIIQLTVESSLTVAGKSNLRSRKSVMSIVDLAGSENAAANSGQRMKEGAIINKSLFTLTKVINMLTEKNPPAYIPYRDSKLTRLLKPCIGGNSTTYIICCVDPQNKEESGRTLKFSERLKLVKGHVTVNEEEEGGQLNKYLDEIERLNKEITDMKQKIKEDEMQEKTKRLDELRAQIIGGSEPKPTHTKALRRQTICAPGVRSFTSSLFTPPTRRTKPLFGLPNIVDESPPRNRMSGPAQVISDSVVNFDHKPSPVAAADLAELEDLRVQNLEHEMKIRELNTEIENIKADAAEELDQLNVELERLNNTNLMQQKNYDEYVRSCESKFSALNEEKEQLHGELTRIAGRCDQLEVQLASEKAVYVTEKTELMRENHQLMDRIGSGEMSVSEREKLIARIEELSTQVATSQLDLNTYKALLEEKEEKENVLAETISTLQYNLKEAATMHEIKLQELYSKLQVAKEEMFRFKADEEFKQSQLQEQIATLKKQSALSVDSLGLEKEEELQRLRDEVTNLQNKLDDAHNAAQRIRAELYEEITSAVSARMTLDKEKISQMEAQLNRLQHINDRMQLEHDEYNGLELRSKEAEIKLKDALELISHKDKLLVQLKEENEQLLQKDDEIRNLKDELSKTKNALITKISALEHSTRKNQDANIEIRELNTTKTALEQQLQKVKTSKESQEEILKNQIHLKDREMQQSKRFTDDRIACLEDKVQKLERLNRDKSMQNVRLQGDVSTLRRDLEQALKQVENGELIVEEKTNSLAEEIQKLQDALSNSQSQARDYCATIEKLEAELKTNKMLTEKSMKEVILLKNALDSETSQQDMNLLKAENARLKKRLIDMEDEQATNKENITRMKCEKQGDGASNLHEEVKTLSQKLKEKNDVLDNGIAKYNNLLADYKTIAEKYVTLKKKYIAVTNQSKEE